MYWGDLSAPDLKEAAGEGFLVVLPCGAIEQHGQHLPVDTDARVVELIARQAAERVDRVVVLPTMPYGMSIHHMEFGGTVTYSLSTYIAVIKDIARAVAHHGFRRMILLNGHGGNTAALQAVATGFLDELNINMLSTTYWELVDPEDEAALLEIDAGMCHASELETSSILALDPELVRQDRYTIYDRPEAIIGEKRNLYKERKLSFGRKFDRFTPTGVTGDPSAASARKGQKYLELAIAATAELFEAVLADEAG